MYVILEEDGLHKLVDQVNKWGKEGFIPCGGVTIHGKLFLQAMYRQDKP